MKLTPLVSIVIPTYNYAAYLETTLNSVFAQTYRPIEVILVDDGSTDRTTDLIHSYPEVRYFYQSNQGVSAARNVGIEAARGEFIALLDADDYWKKNKLKIQINYMMDYPKLGYTSTRALSVSEISSQRTWLHHPESSYEKPQVIVPSTLVVRKKIFNLVGGFSTHYQASEDTEWLWRAKDAGILTKNISKALTIKRLHDFSLSSQMRDTQKSRLFRVIRESISRQNFLVKYKKLPTKT